MENITDKTNKLVNTKNIIKPPSDEVAEKAILSSMMLDREATSIAIEVLHNEDFYRPDYAIVFDAIKELYNKSSPIDIITLRNKLTELGRFDQIGGLEFLADISMAVGSSVNIRHYIKIVEEKYILRRLISTANNIQQLSYSGIESIDNIMEVAEKSIFDIMQGRHSDEFHHIHSIASDALATIESIFQSKGKLTGIATGFIDFDIKTAGLQRSDLILLAARPSMGKTAFALNIIQNAAIRQNIPVAVFSLEMSKEQLVNRMLCAEACVDAQKLRTGDLSEQDWESLIFALGPLTEAPIYIDDTPSISPMDIRSKCRRLKVEKGIGLVVIDYLQLMSGNGRNDSRQQEISEISRSLKAIAREIDAPVIALSQLSRACEQRSDHRPMLSDLRESGAIEQDADVVAFLYRDEYYFPDTEKPNQAELIIAKQRNGPTGTIDLSWNGQFTKFNNLAR